MNSLRIRTSKLVLPLSFALIFAASSAAPAANLYVANNGTDGAGCGAKTDPCRSITQGIASAAPGDGIVVGPGRYGDLDDDGVLGETGEETDGPCLMSETCMIVVNKLVTITSSDGAFATVIHQGSSSPNVTVGLDASGAVFGGLGRGFTVEAATSSGGGIVTFAPTTDTTVIGNVVRVGNGGLGIATTGERNRILNNRIVCDANGIGIALIGTGDPNVATGNTTTGGIYGFYLQGSGQVMSGNIVHGNAFGIVLEGTGFTVSKSSFMGNTEAGILAYDSTTTATVSECNIVGNGLAAATNCGLEASGSAITVTGTWWGAATGPGADPADDACNETVGSTTPFATAAIKARPKPLR